MHAVRHPGGSHASASLEAGLWKNQRLLASVPRPPSRRINLRKAQSAWPVANPPTIQHPAETRKDGRDERDLPEPRLFQKSRKQSDQKQSASSLQHHQRYTC